MTNQPVALILGVTGQDGSYLAEFLLNKGYEVHGVIRRSSSFSTGRIDHIFDKLRLHYGDVLDGSAMSHLMGKVRPREVYNLAAQSHVRVSFDMPGFSSEVGGIGALNVLEAVREYRDREGADVRFYQASSSEMFGSAAPPQSETTAFHPRSPYACAKVFAHHATVNYREAYGLHASCGILFNHESPRRTETFVTRKITRAVGRIKMGLQDDLVLGNLEAKRDWGFAGDYVRAMWLMLQRDKPDDFVIATGVTTSVREFCERAFVLAGLRIADHVEFDPRLLRPTEVDVLCGDASKAREELGWTPTVKIDDLIEAMVDADMELARREKTLVENGHAVVSGR